MVYSCLSLTYISFHYYQNFAHLRHIGNWYSTATHAKCDVISRQNKKIQTEISHQQNVAAQKYERTGNTVLNTLSHHAIKIFVSWALLMLTCKAHINLFYTFKPVNTMGKHRKTQTPIYSAFTNQSKWL